jgi:integrase
VARAETVVFSPEEVTRLFAAAAGDRLEAFYVLAVTTGMRLGELFALHWPDVDLAKHTVHIRRTLVEVNGKLELAEPKTQKSRRSVYLPEMAVAALRRHRALMAAEGFGDVPWVFCNTQGRPMRRSHFHAYQFKPLLKRAGLPDIRFHDLRHTSATLLLSAGVHPKVVQERLGHSQIGVTLDIYSHVLPGLQQEAAEKLDEMLAGGGV